MICLAVGLPAGQLLMYVYTPCKNLVSEVATNI